MNAINLKEVQASAVEKFDGNLIVSNTPNLVKLSFDKIPRLNGGLVVSNTPSLVKLSFNEILILKGNLTLNNPGPLNNLSLPKLNVIIGDFFLTYVNKPEFKLPSLNAICGKLKVIATQSLNKLILPNGKAYEVKTNIETNSISELTLGEMVPKFDSVIKIKSNHDILSKLNKAIKFNYSPLILYDDKISDISLMIDYIKNNGVAISHSSLMMDYTVKLIWFSILFLLTL